MRLSEAIRLGAMTKAQNFGGFYGVSFYFRRKSGFPWFTIVREETSCAIGAAFEATGSGYRQVVHKKGETVSNFRGEARVLKQDKTYQQWEHPSEWSSLWYADEVCPQCKVIQSVYRLIPHLNDQHRWSRERIASFVETIERQQEQPQTEAHHVQEEVRRKG